MGRSGETARPAAGTSLAGGAQLDMLGLLGQADEVTAQSCSTKHGLLSLSVLTAHGSLFIAHCSALLSFDSPRQPFSTSYLCCFFHLCHYGLLSNNPLYLFSPLKFIIQSIILTKIQSQRALLQPRTSPATSSSPHYILRAPIALPAITNLHAKGERPRGRRGTPVE